jgi:serine/threonine protein phosphatase 1
MAGRTIAIGDIHGCSDVLAALIDAVRPGPEDTLVTLGDHIDRGPDSRGVLDQLITLSGRCRLVPLLGDHEEMLVDALRDMTTLRRWLTYGGTETLHTYGWTPGLRRHRLVDWFPEPHREFLAGCLPYFEADTHLFVHAGFLPELPMNQQPGQVLRWRVTDGRTAIPHHSGKAVFVGHTPQLSGEVLDLGFLFCIDANCARGGWLTALEAGTNRVWQADCLGRLKA